jgi:U3 small nucleolar RNA-associated protein 10
VEVLSSLCRGLALCFEHDDGRPLFATPGRAAAVGPALVRQLSLAGSAPALARRGAAPAVAMLCRAVGDDVAWKPLHFGVLVHTRDGRPAVRAAAVETLGLCFRVVGDGFLVILPEALGFLSELLEDPDGGAECAARALLKDVEEMSGEKPEAFM